VRKISLRRHDPDQVLRVEALSLLSARNTGSPFIYKNEYTAVLVTCQVKFLKLNQDL
jgi:hypothetical protein